MDHTYDARTPSRPTNDRNRLHRSDSDFESIPGQRGPGTRQRGEPVREVTERSLPRVGPFFAGRDHTTVLHSVRRMEDRAARDPELLAYMASIKQVRPVGGLPSPSKTGRPTLGKLFSPGLHPRPCRECFGSRADESHSRWSVGGRLASSPSTWAQFLVRAVAAEPSREKRRTGEWLPLAPFAPRRVRRRLPRVPRALAARPPRGRRAGQGRRQPQGHRAQLLRSNARSGHDRTRP